MKLRTAPVEKKVAATINGALLGIITWILVTFIPSFHAGLPAPLATFLPMILGTVVATGAAWQAHHTPREEEIVAAALKHLQSSGFLAALPADMQAEVVNEFGRVESALTAAAKRASGKHYGFASGGVVNPPGKGGEVLLQSRPVAAPGHDDGQ